MQNKNEGKMKKKIRFIEYAPARLQREMTWSRSLGLDYTASDPISNLILEADDMRREGNVRASAMLIGAAYEVARCQKIVTVLVRNAELTRPKKAKVKIA
jgi:hypothetical protein